MDKDIEIMKSDADYEVKIEAAGRIAESMFDASYAWQDGSIPDGVDDWLMAGAWDADEEITVESLRDEWDSA